MHNTHLDRDHLSAVPSIQLMLEAQRLLVLPAPGGEPFELPPVPLSLLQSVQRCQDLFWQRHQRCLGALLLLEVETRRWRAPIPPQRSRPEAACWLVDRQVLVDEAPDGALAGTMQRSTASHAEELLAGVPRFDGLHLINWHVDGQASLFGFARVAGAVEVVAVEALLLDEQEAAVDTIEQQVTFL